MNKLLVNYIQQCIKINTHQHQIRFTPGIQVGSTFENQLT